MSTELEIALPDDGLRTVPCNLCGGSDPRELHPAALPSRNGHASPTDLYACTSNAYGRCGPIVQCRQCGLVYQNPVPAAPDITHAYEEVVDQRYEQERIGRLHTFARDLAELERYTRGGRLLDVGCHIGLFLEVAQNSGWEAWGVEPSHWAAGRAQEHGLRVLHGTLDTVDLPEDSFDAVTLWDVIEHLPDPLAELRKCRQLLRPGGVVAICTMDVEALFPRLVGRRWPWYMQMHLIYFSKRTLTAMLEAAGYEVLGMVPHKRVVRADYLASRLEGYFRPAARMLGSLIRGLGQRDRLVTVDLGDLFLTFARRPN